MLQDIQIKIEAEFDNPLRNEAKLTYLKERQAKLELEAKLEAEKESLMIKIEAELETSEDSRNELKLSLWKERLQIIETGCSRISPTVLY